MGKSRLWGCLLACVVGLTLLFAAGCGGGSDSAGPADTAPKEDIKIGAIFDLTGATADVGVPYAEGARAYVETVNTAGGINGRTVKLLEIDYAYQIPRATEAYNKLVKQDQVAAILGWGTGDTDALKGFIARDKIPYLSGSYSELLLNIDESPYNFLVAASYTGQAKAALKWIKDEWTDTSRPPRVALIYNDSPFGKSHLEDTKAFGQEIGIDMVGEEAVDLRTLDATPQMLNLKNKKADFAVIQGTSNMTATVLKDSKKLGLETRFIGLNWAADEKVVQLAGAAGEGYIGVIPFAFPGDDVPGMAAIGDWLTKNNKTYADINQKFVQGWYSTMVMLEAVRLAGDEVTGETIRGGLESMVNFDSGGLAAPVTFTKESHRGTDLVRLAEVQNGKFEYLTDWIGYK
ncbi:MAG: ABC transporter substrate-binding protein [Desulforudis sp.]|nr:MAG: ABC transporter substrate-binding protein [Desulforudis sp.]